RHTFNVVMTCTGCSSAVERALKRLGDIHQLDISLKDQTVIVDTIHDQDKVLECIKKTGKAVTYVSTTTTVS
ncbi:ATX1 antioxidant protein 1, partial [Coelomomyces lativittatus]